ncbi:Ig-like domain repeat protein [Paenibacillus sp. TRM 82003]|nr:Ig-like domain repeat protein [Paenibacillus sp. TRM 82003]
MKDPAVMQQKRGGSWWKRLIPALLFIFIMTAGMLERPEQAVASYRHVSSYTSFEGTPLSGPREVAIDNGGKVYVADSDNSRIVVYNPDGTEYGKIEEVIYENGHFAVLGYPTALTIKNDILYMVNGVAVHRFDINNNNKPISEDIPVSYLTGGGVYGIAVDSGGTMYTAGYYHITNVSPSGTPSVYFDLNIPDKTHNAEDIAIDEQDNLYVMSGGSYIHKYDKYKNLLDSWHYGVDNLMTGVAYHDGVLYMSISNSSSVGFRKVSAMDGRILAEHINPEYYDYVDSIAIHPVTKEIYLTYRYGGVRVYKDVGTTVTATASSYSIQYGNAVTFDVSVTANNGLGTPAGTVALMDGDVKLADVNLAGGTASYTTTQLPGGTRSITAVYQGAEDYAGNTSTAMVIEVARKASTITVQSSDANPAWGLPVTFTAIVNGADPSGETPTGTVTFSSGTTVLGTGMLDEGQAVLTSDGLAAGAHTITAQYGGANAFEPSDGTVLQTVDKAVSAISPSSTREISVFGETVTFMASVAVQAPGTGTPTGDVAFKIGSTTLGVSTLNAAWAMLDVSNLEVGSHTITAEYGGDDSVVGSSGTLNLTVQKASTSIDVMSSKNAIRLGETVTFQANAAVEWPGAGTPTGAVTFKNGATTLGVAALSGGTATLEVSNLEAGMHTVTAEYGGDGSFMPGNGTVVQTVSKLDTTTVLTASPGSVVFGEKLAFTANVSSAGGTPEGTVTFRNGSTVLGVEELVNGEAVLSGVGDLEVGAHTITAEYDGSASFAGSVGTVQQTVGRAGTSTSVATSQSVSVSGEPVTFTATVEVEAPGAGTPTGTVTFKNGTTTLGVAALSGSTATLDVSSLEVGSHRIVAEYGGDGSFDPGSGTVEQTVNKLNTTTALTASPGPIVFGEAAAFTATVYAASGTPEGTVTFRNGSTVLGVEALVDGKAVLNGVGDLAVGTHAITAEYAGLSWFAGSADTVQQTVGQAVTSTSVVTSQGVSVYGETVTFTAAVAVEAPGAGAPTGSITFKNGAATLDTVTLSGGTATLKMSNLGVGTHTITAEYMGDGSFLGSGSTVEQTVNKANTVVNVSSSQGTSIYGDAVTFIATVTAAPPGAGVPTGSVTFKNGPTTLGVVRASAGTATLDVSALDVGTHTTTAEYSGDDFFAPGSGVMTQEVGKVGSTLDVTVSKAAVVYGERVSFTAAVTAAVYGREEPTGTVTLQLDAAPIGSGSLDSGVLTLHAHALSVGSHLIVVHYSGDGSYAPTSQTLAVTVSKADSITNAAISTDTSMVNEVVSITAQVGAVAPGNGTPSGEVTLRHGTEAIGTGVLVDGEVVIEIDELPVGTYTLELAYNGDELFRTSKSSPLMLTVGKGQTAASVQANGANIAAGNSISLTAEILAVPPKAGIPTGAVTFFDQDGEIGEVVMDAADNGVAKLIIPQGWRAGRYGIAVKYEGDGRFYGSESATFDLVVNAPAPSPSPPPTSQPSAPATPAMDTVEPIANTEGKIAIPPGGSGSVSLDEMISVSIPAEMSDKEVSMTIEEVASLAELTLSQQTLVSNVYEILSNLEGTFSKEITISFVFDASALGRNQTAAISYFDEEERVWIEIGGIIDGNVIAVPVDHLTKFAVFAVEKEEMEAPSAESVVFTDTQSHWGEDTIHRATAYGVVNGYPDGSFRPDHPITRAEFLVMLAGAVQMQGTGDSPMEFQDDAKIGAWARSAVYASQQAGIVTGYGDGTFRPEAPITRVEMAMMVARTLGMRVDSVTPTDFSDDSLIPQWAKGAAAAVREARMITGRSNNNFEPYADATRAEAATILMRVLES